MTNIGHFRVAAKVLEGKSDIPTRLWVAPPTKMDATILDEEGYYAILGRSGARMEMPGCSLCMAQPGADSQWQHRDVHLDAQLPEPARHRHFRLSRFRRIGLDLRPDGQYPERRRIHGTGEGGQCQRRPKCIDMNFDKIAEFSDVANTVTV